MENLVKEINFDKNGLVVVVTQDARTDEVLMLAYANLEAVNKTIETKKAHYFSRSRNKLWLKGEESGNFQDIDSIAVDCDGDALLYKVFQTGNACHTGHHSCFFRKKSIKESGKQIPKDEQIKSANDKKNSASLSDELVSLYEVIKDRKLNPKEGSYTNYLFEKGIDKILKKISEESGEVIIASKGGDDKEVVLEIADLLYHLMTLLVQKDIDLDAVGHELASRKK